MGPSLTDATPVVRRGIPGLWMTRRVAADGERGQGLGRQHTLGAQDREHPRRERLQTAAGPEAALQGLAVPGSDAGSLSSSGWSSRTMLDMISGRTHRCSAR